MPELVVGSPPRGEDYFGQEDLIESIWSGLDKDNILIEAPRRFGKTGAMYQLLDYPREPYKPLFINVEDTQSADNFIIELLAILLKEHQFQHAIASLWEKTKGLGK
ncbi:MAG: hypothetical protein C4527_28945 [Candidatus Omnitrophota bacterium]|jgi:predicted AAA+ superfamily ATPase|nr:MAG: hypothetical protein C4527_28945 [Candidatus Omnitrophota bacterium]